MCFPVLRHPRCRLFTNEMNKAIFPRASSRTSLLSSQVPFLSRFSIGCSWSTGLGVFLGMIKSTFRFFLPWTPSHLLGAVFSSPPMLFLLKFWIIGLPLSLQLVLLSRKRWLLSMFPRRFPPRLQIPGWI